VQSLFQADGRVGDSSFGRELSRTGNLLIIDGVAGAAIYKRSTNSEMPWERLGKFEDLLPGLVPQNLTPYASPDGNRLFFTTSTRNENGSPLASSAITYVVDSSDADFSNWTVIQKLSPQNVSSTDIFATSTNIAENNRYYFGVFDSVFKRILTFEIQ